MFKCDICDDNKIKFAKIETLYSHIEDEHMDLVPKDFTVPQYVYYLKTGRTHGTCRMCKKETPWNPITNKYNVFCTDEKCKKEYRKLFEKRMIGKYGKIHLLNDPDQQKLMLSHRKISGQYTWSDGVTKIGYTGTYELDFLRMLDVLMNFDPKDIISPSPHTYYYMYQKEKKFYIPDFFIPSLDLEIEIKDGGDNPNMHHKIQKIDKEKEKLKDEVMMSQNTFNYIKIVNKNYEPFFEFLFKMKERLSDNNDGKPIKPIFIV